MARKHGTSAAPPREHDDRLEARLNKQSHQLARIERDQQIAAESFGSFARLQFLVTAPVPDSDRAARTLAQERFKAFVEQISRRISSGRGLIGDVLALGDAAGPEQ